MTEAYDILSSFVDVDAFFDGLFDTDDMTKATVGAEGADGTSAGGEGTEQASTRTYNEAGMVEPNQMELLYEAEALEYLVVLQEWIQWIIETGDPQFDEAMPQLEALNRDLLLVQERGIPEGRVEDTVRTFLDRVSELSGPQRA